MAKQRKKIKGRPQPSLLQEQPEDFRIDIDRILRDFISDPDMVEYSFPKDLSNVQRAYIHERARKFGLKSKSTGSEPHRMLTISKKLQAARREYFELKLNEPGVEAISTLLSEHRNLLDEVNSTKTDKFCGNMHKEASFGRLNVTLPLQVDPPISSPLKTFREALPVFAYRDDFLNVLDLHQIILIAAETGSGKTTQIPQYILEACCESKRRCRIVCTQPRRISTVAVAERVSQERGEKVGYTVGYQIKLESKLGIKTSLIYCTTGVLLRTLMGGDECCNNITHVIVDEIHERDKFSDFLLICLKQCIQRYPQLRVILMSATVDVDLYQNYFDNKVFTMFIPGRTYPVTELFLDEILPLINYENENMKTLRAIQEKNIKQDVNLSQQICQNLAQDFEIDDDLRSEMDNALVECMKSGSDDCFAHIMQLILCDSVPVNTADAATGYTPVIVAAAHGNVEVLEQLINLGGDLNHTSNDGRSAKDWAEYCGQNEIVHLIQASEMQANFEHNKELDTLRIYNKSISENVIDFDLVLALIKYIHYKVDKSGGILVFLPGYEDIMNCFNTITNSNLNMNQIKLCILHGSMQIKTQHEVFNEFPNKQKIILSTNVAETSITIDGVRFVIDSGKAKQKTYDSISGTSAMQTSWISMACVKQRAGRAGRTQSGACFHVFSKKRYESFLVNTTPEILRVPLHELCLHTKMLAPEGISIAEFLSYAIEPPTLASVKKAVQRLESLGALTKDEDLTSLGAHLLQLSVEPHLGKMLIYSIIFKCLDPILTIVATLAHKEPFILPSVATQRSLSNTKKHLLSAGSLSDHMSLLKAFQDWQEAKLRHREYRFCTENFLSPSAMEMILLTRIQLLGQLRAGGFVHMSRRDNIHELNDNSENWSVVKATLAAGLYPNVAFSDQTGLYTMTENRVIPHTSSCIKNDLGNFTIVEKLLWVIFEEMSKFGRTSSFRCGTAITPATVALTCGSLLEFEPDNNFLIIDNSIAFRIAKRETWQFRKCLDNLVQKKIKNPRLQYTHIDNDIVHTLGQVLAAEDSAMSLKSPTGIGGKPKFIYTPNVAYKGSPQKYSRQNQFYNGNDQSDYEQGFRYSDVYDNSSASSSSASEWHLNGDRNVRTFKSAQQHPYHPTGSRFNNTPKFAKQPNYSQRSYSSNSKQSEHLINVVAPRDPQITENSRFFFIKPTEVRNVIISISQGTWNFSPQTEKKLFKFISEGFCIILLFTVRGTSFIQGVARLLDTNNGIPNRPCHIEWLGTNSVSYDTVKHFIHPKLHITEDGQEVPSAVGRKICAMLMANPNANGNNKRPILGGKHK